jgi:hypothetical protein
MYVYTNAGVTADVRIVWHLRAPDDEAISILFGEEQVSVDFYDLESLERLRDVAEEGAQRLRTVIETNTNARAVKEAGGLVGTRVR